MGRWHAAAAIAADAWMLSSTKTRRARRGGGASAVARLDPAERCAVGGQEPRRPHCVFVAVSRRRDAIEAGCHAGGEATCADSRCHAQSGRPGGGPRRGCPVPVPVSARSTPRRPPPPGLGKICHIDLVVCSAGAEGQPERVVNQVMFDVLPHPLSLLVRIVGTRFAEFVARCAAAPGELGCEALGAGRRLPSR